MVTSPAKRPASASPDAPRLSKRPATSSPEEGELDDPSPPLSLPSSLPAKPQPASAKPKVPFPFKKKGEPPVNGFAGGGELNESDGRLSRDADARRRPGRGPGRPSMVADHWEPPSRYYPPQRWDAYPQRDYRDDRDRVRDRGRSPPPPPSYSPRSRSPSGSPSGPREKHRLPAHRPLNRDVSPSPLRVRDRDRERDARERHSDREERERDRERRYREEKDDRHYHPDDLNRYDRRDYPHRRVDDRRGGRHEVDYDYDRPSRYDDRNRGRRMDSYRPSPPCYAPVSPLPHSPSQNQPPPSTQATSSPPTVLPPPHSPSSQPTENPQVAGTPPPPAQSPPPAPPPDERLFTKNDMLPESHAHVAIPMKRPGAPKDIHSPPSILHHQPPPADKDNEREKGELKVRPVRTREVVRRSRKSEMEAYGRTFRGCGQQSEYAVTTKLGEGTFGEVHKAIQKSTSKVVALKRILMHNEKEGMPVTALREIKILKALKHPCIVNILDMFVVQSNQKDPLSVYMVFPYMDHDLAGLLENERVKLQPSHIKLYMKQLLEGTEYMHRNHILHRDMKAANLLISNNGNLKVADFGLARSFDPNVSRTGLDSRGRERRYTNCVVTRWYRPPELLLGARHYGGEVDMWGIGCVLGEMFSRRPILPGTSDLDQLEKIWQLCGTPNQHSWPNFDALPGCEGVKRFSTYLRRIKSAYESVGPETCDLLDKLLICNPRERITAAQALDHEYFWTDPLPADPKTLPSYESSHEFDKRGHRNQHPLPGPPIPPHVPPHVPPPHGYPPHHHHPHSHPHPLPPPHHLPHGSHRPPPLPGGPPGGAPPYYHYPPGPGRPPPGYGGPPGAGRGARRPPAFPPPGGGPPPRLPPYLPAKPHVIGRDDRDRDRERDRDKDREKDRERERDKDKDGRDRRDREGRKMDRNGYADDGGGELNYG